MLAIVFGVFLMFYGVSHVTNVQDVQPGTVYVTHILDSRADSYQTFVDRPIVVKPLSETAFKGIVHQAFDYSCGSASLTTLMNGYLGRNFDERQIMQGLLKFGETQRIIKRRGFSLLDMKRLVSALGYKSGGYRGTFDDLRTLNQPALVPIHYSGFKHFVVVKKVENQRVFIADPALGNLSFPQARFKLVWDGNVMFLVFANGKPVNKLQVSDEDMRYFTDEQVNLIALQQVYENEFPVESMEHNADKAASTHLVLDVGSSQPLGGAPTTGTPILVPTRTFFRAR